MVEGGLESKKKIQIFQNLHMQQSGFEVMIYWPKMIFIKVNWFEKIEDSNS